MVFAERRETGMSIQPELKELSTYTSRVTQSEGLGYSELKGLYGPLCGEMCQLEYLLLLVSQPV